MTGPDDAEHRGEGGAPLSDENAEKLLLVLGGGSGVDDDVAADAVLERFEQDNPEPAGLPPELSRQVDEAVERMRREQDAVRAAIEPLLRDERAQAAGKLAVLQAENDRLREALGETRQRAANAENLLARSREELAALIVSVAQVQTSMTDAARQAFDIGDQVTYTLAALARVRLLRPTTVALANGHVRDYVPWDDLRAALAVPEQPQ